VIRVFIKLIISIVDIVLLFPCVVLALLARFVNRRIDIGLGPEPLINNIYHKKALELYGFSAETFVNSVNFITDEYDVQSYLMSKGPLRGFISYYLYIRAIFKYKCLYIYFNGGPLFPTVLLQSLEPYLYKLSNVKVVVLPYGGDVQELTRSRNIYFKHVYFKDYPEHRLHRRSIGKRIDRWIQHADHVISGCEWVDYMYHWDTLMLAHFSIDVNEIMPASDNSSGNNGSTLKILHAPNHVNIKGTAHLIQAVNELKDKGVNIELILLTKVSNKKILRTMIDVDLVADQFVIGWYAMFAIEAMAMGKPVLCYLRDDLIELYRKAGLIQKDEIPLINADVLVLKEKILWAYENKNKLKEIGRKSREYVIKHHSLEAIGKVFKEINIRIGIM